jgi:hypothetical protein
LQPRVKHLLRTRFRRKTQPDRQLTRSPLFARGSQLLCRRLRDGSIPMESDENQAMYPSSRHAKITGDFAEAMVLYWLSKSGHECARVDHTGIDLIASKPKMGLFMGISVKSRCRRPGTEGDSVKLLPLDVQKARKACEAWRLIPYFAIVVDAAATIRGFLISADHLEASYSRKGKVGYWRMSKRDLANYAKDLQVKSFSLQWQIFEGDNLEGP